MSKHTPVNDSAPCVEDEIQDSPKKIRRRPDISHLTVEQQIICFNKRKLIEFYLSYRDKKQKIPKHELDAFLEGLGCTLEDLNIRNRSWLSQLAKGYQEYKHAYPEEDAVNFFNDLPIGRPAGQDVDEEMETLVLGAYITRDRKSFFKDVADLKDAPDMGINTLPSVDYVYRVIRKAIPEKPISQSTLKRLIKRLEKKYAAIIKLAREGERALWADAIPKMENDCDRADEGWQSDARYLSFYAMYKGKPVRVVLVIIIDVFSRCVLRFALLPREDQDKDGKWHNIDFTGKQVRVLLASTMHATKRRCYYFITDKGAQYQEVAPHLAHLTTDKEPPITPILGFPGHPWCRGIVEVYNYLIDQLLHELPGFVENEDDPICWREARGRKDLLKFDVLEKAIKAKLEWWNTQPQNGKPSRFELWKNGPGVLLPAPQDIRLEILAGSNRVYRKTAVVRDVGIEYKRTPYKLEDAEDSYVRWTKAAAERRKVPFRAISFDTELVVLVDLQDGRGWERVVPQSQQQPSRKKHSSEQWGSVKRIYGELGEAEEAYNRAVAKRMGSLPKTDAITKEPYFADEIVATAATATTGDTGEEAQGETLTNTTKPLSPVSVPLVLDALSDSVDTPRDESHINRVEPPAETVADVATELVSSDSSFSSLMSPEEALQDQAKRSWATRLRQRKLDAGSS